MSSNDLFAEIWGSPEKGGQDSTANQPSPSRRPRSTSPSPAANRPALFHSDNEDDEEIRPKSPKRKKAKLTELPPELDAYFPADDDADLDFSFADKGADLATLTKEAEARHAKNVPQRSKAAQDGKAGGSQAAASKKGKSAAGSSAINPLAIGLSDDEGADGKGDKDGKEEKKRKPLPKLDEARLLGDNGFRALLTQTKKFKVHNAKAKDPKKEKLSAADKDPEFANLSRFIEMTQLWAHRMYPKGQFSDTVERVEKLCHSRRMVTAMSVWKDEYHHGPLSSRIHPPSSPPADNDDEEGADGTYTRELDAEGRPMPRPGSQAPSSRGSSRPPTMPTSASSGASEIDDEDLDAIMADMARTQQASSSSRGNARDEDEDMDWDVADEMENRAPSSSKPAAPKPSVVAPRKIISAEEEEAAMWADMGGDEDELMAFMDSVQEEQPNPKPSAPPDSRTPSLSNSVSPTANNVTDREEAGMSVEASSVPPDIQKRREQSQRDFEAGWDDMYE